MHRNASNKHVEVKGMDVKHTAESIRVVEQGWSETTVRHALMKRRKIVTLPSPTRQGSQTWCKDFRGLLHLSFALVSFSNSSLCSFHEGGRWEMEVGAVTVSSFPQTCLANPSKRQWGITILPFFHNECMVAAVCFLRWCPPPRSGGPSSRTSWCRRVGEFQGSSP